MSNFLTIAICCYREGDWLRECWESVLAQNDDRWEAVLVMDGGADAKTQAVFAALEHPRLRKFACRENLRHGGTRNKAFELTRSPYHLYVDADDLLVPSTVRLMLDAFEQNAGAAMVYGDIEFFGDIVQVKKHPATLTCDVLARLDALQGSGAAYRMSAWRDLGGFAREMWASGSDFDFNIGLAEAGYRFHHVDDVVYRYRRYNTSNSEKNAWRCWEKHEMVVQRHPRFFADKDRCCAFLSRAYAYSFRALYESGDLRQARQVARRALARDAVGQERHLMRILTVLPLPFFMFMVRIWRLRKKIVAGS